MLTAYARNVLKTELGKPDYDGMTALQAWTWLAVPYTPAPITRPSGVMLTPLVVARLLGPAVAEAIALALKNAFPTIATYLLEQGVDPANPDARAFLGGLVTAGVITAGDAALLAATAVVITPSAPVVRFDHRFYPELWPHVAIDGSPGADADPAIHGFPNSITRDEFDAAWALARGGN